MKKSFWLQQQHILLGNKIRHLVLHYRTRQWCLKVTWALGGAISEGNLKWQNNIHQFIWQQNDALEINAPEDILEHHEAKELSNVRLGLGHKSFLDNKQ